MSGGARAGPGDPPAGDVSLGLEQGEPGDGVAGRQVPQLLARPWVWQPLGLALAVPAEWPLAGLGGVVGAGGPPLRGSPWPRRALVPAPAGRGGPCHGLPRPLVRPLLLPVGGNGGVRGAAGTPAKSSGGGAGTLLLVGCCWAAGGGRAGGGRPPSGGSRTRGPRGAALPPLGSGAALQAQQTMGLPAAALHGGIEEVLHECRRAVLQAGLQHPAQDLFVQPEAAQDGHDEFLQHGCC